MDLKVYDWANQGMYLNLKETLGQRDNLVVKNKFILWMWVIKLKL